jgi:hypothetical protein
VRVETNVKRVKKSVKDTQGRYILRTRALAKKQSVAGRDNVRSFVSSPTFPGYAMTGALKKKVVASEPQKGRSGWTAIFRVLLQGRVAKYAKIHEVGGQIPIKNPAQIRAMMAALAARGQRRAASGQGQKKGLRFIKIRAKRYFAKGTEKTRREWNLARLKREF